MVLALHNRPLGQVRRSPLWVQKLRRRLNALYMLCGLYSLSRSLSQDQKKQKFYRSILKLLHSHAFTPGIARANKALYPGVLAPDVLPHIPD
jgi:hypothetical protein